MQLFQNYFQLLRNNDWNLLLQQFEDSINTKVYYHDHLTPSWYDITSLVALQAKTSLISIPTSPPVDASPLQLEMSWKGVLRPLWCTESSCGLPFIIVLLVVTPQAKASLCDFQNSATTYFTTCWCIPTAVWNVVEGCFKMFLTRWTQLQPP